MHYFVPARMIVNEMPRLLQSSAGDALVDHPHDYQRLGFYDRLYGGHTLTHALA